MKNNENPPASKRDIRSSQKNRTKDGENHPLENARERHRQDQMLFTNFQSKISVGREGRKFQTETTRGPMPMGRREIPPKMEG